MKLKIVNGKRFILSILVAFIILLTISIIFTNQAYSHGETNYRTECIILGDTLWNLAKEEKNNNKYYQTKQIQYIVEDIKEINHLDNTSLKEGQIIQIPTM